MSRTRIKLCDRFLAALLSFMMIVAMIPVTTLQAFAATEDYLTITVTEMEDDIRVTKLLVVVGEIPDEDEDNE